MRRFALGIGLLTCVACHNAAATMGAPSSFAAPENSGPQPVPAGSAPLLTGPGLLTFVSGESDQPVAAARVTIEGRSYLTDGAGQVAVDRMAAAVGVEASGFFERRALARVDRFSLWPRTSPTGLDEDYTARLVYNCTDPRCADGGEALGRVPQGVVTLRPSRDLQADRAALTAIDEAAQLWSAATRGNVVFVLGGASGPGTVIELDVDPTDSVIVARGAAGVTRRQYSGAAIVRARITLRSVELARRVPLNVHELGHAFGLSHSPRVGDVMWNGPELYDTADLSAREKLAITLMLQRFSGNRFPDTEDGLNGVRGSSARNASVVICSP